MFGIGGPELVVILIVGLIFIGPDKLPQVAKTVGGGLRDLRRAANLAQAELRETMDDLMREADVSDVVASAVAATEPQPPQDEDATATDHDADDSAAKPDTTLETTDPGDFSVRAESPLHDAGEIADEDPELPEDSVFSAADFADQPQSAAQQDTGFRFDDDPDDWDPDAINDIVEDPSAETPSTSPPTGPPQQPAVTAPTAMPQGIEGTQPRSMPPMRAAHAPPTSPPLSDTRTTEPNPIIAPSIHPDADGDITA